MKFKPGDRIKNIREDLTYAFVETGTVLGCFINNLGNEAVSIRWDMKIQGRHDCNGLCEDGYGWNVSADYVELLDASVNYNHKTRYDIARSLK